MYPILIRSATAVDTLEIARIVVHAFKEDFTTVTQDMELLARAVSSVVVSQRFFVACKNGQLLGVMACSDKTGRAMKIHTPNVIRHLGLVRGLLGAADFREKFSAPLPFPAITGYIEFVAIAEHARRQGLATRLLHYVVHNTPYTEYLLDVLAQNTAAICCYRKFGFQEIDRQTETLPKDKRRERIFMGYVRGT